MTERAKQLPAELKIEDLTAIIDNREQIPWDMAPMKVEFGTLPTADISLKGFEHIIAIERKSRDDLVSCITGGRERFERSLKRMPAYEVRAVLVECSWAELERGEWRSRVTPASVTGSVLKWMSWGIPFLMCGSRDAAQSAAIRILYGTARRRWRELRAMHQSMGASGAN